VISKLPAEPKGGDIRIAVEAIRSIRSTTSPRAHRAARGRIQDHWLRRQTASSMPSAPKSHVKPGDEVSYAGSLMSPGYNAEFTLVDERVVGKKPKTLSFAQDAALPLTSITAWEFLFDRLGAVTGQEPLSATRFLITGGRGRVGSY